MLSPNFTGRLRVTGTEKWNRVMTVSVGYPEPYIQRLGFKKYNRKTNLYKFLHDLRKTVFYFDKAYKFGITIPIFSKLKAF